MVNWQIGLNKLILKSKDNTIIKNIPVPWLHDHENANWNKLTNQKQNPASSTILDDQIESVSQEGNNLRIEWKKRKEASVISLSQLTRKTTNESRYGLPERKGWKTLERFPSSSYSKVNQKDILSDLSVYGVHLVKDMPNTIEDTENFIRLMVGPPRETFYGKMWDTAPRKENINDTAYTYDALDPHTDTCYLVDSPGLQCFNCVAQDSGTGGQTKLVDSEYLVKKLENEQPETFQYFVKTPLVFHHTEKGLHCRVSSPVITLEAGSNKLKQFRYNEYDLAPLDYLSEKEIDEFYKHNLILHKAIQEAVLLSKLKLGEMLILDNHRVLHGRTAFKGYRNLIGCYVGADDWIMRARSLLSSSN